jgi:uncharacterized RDD family membrane protein YckC
MSGAGIPPGWYPDPANASQQRYWDGVAWTDATAPAAPVQGYGAPTYGAPTYGAPGYGAPGYGTPGYGAPGYGTPGYGTTQVGYGYAQAIGPPLAGFWARFAAYFLDALILGIPANILSLALFDPVDTNSTFSTSSAFTWSSAGGPIAFQLLVFAVNLAYFAYFEGTSGQTIGKKALGICVVDANTLQPGVGIGRGIGRYFARILSSIVCYLGYFWMLWDDQNQTWHDKLARVKVVKVPK